MGFRVFGRNRQFGVLLGLLSSSGYAAYITSLAPILWLRYRETSGGTAVNSGTGGSTLDATINAATLGQTDVMGANEAFLFNGTTDAMTITNHALLSGLTVWTTAVLVNVAGLGGGNAGRFFTHSGRVFYTNSLRNVVLEVLASTTTGVATSSNVITLSQPYWLFSTYDNAGDRKPRLYIGRAGAVNETAYTSQVAAAGTLSAPGGNYILGNNASTGGIRGMSGLYGEHQSYNRLLTAAEMLRIVQLTGV